MKRTVFVLLAVLGAAAFGPVPAGAADPSTLTPEDLARRTVADSTLAGRDLGYAPEVGLEEGLRAEIAYVEELLAVEAAQRANET